MKLKNIIEQWANTPKTYVHGDGTICRSNTLDHGPCACNLHEDGKSCKDDTCALPHHKFETGGS
jgi:hypothetical protein